jgi:predicted Zn-dependent protease
VRTVEPRLSPRWREDVPTAVTVRIDDASTLAGWTPAYRAEVVAALKAWEEAGSPVSFTVVPNNDRADVRIHWIDKFDSRYEGWTTVAWGEAGWLINGDVTLALRSPRGQLLTSGERAQVALHEIGHVLGLGHNDSITSVMAPMVKVTAVAPADIAALRALYLPRDSSEFTLSLAQLTALHGRCAARRI